MADEFHFYSRNLPNISKVTVNILIYFCYNNVNSRKKVIIKEILEYSQFLEKRLIVRNYITYLFSSRDALIDNSNLIDV